MKFDKLVYAMQSRHIYTIVTLSVLLTNKRL